MLNKSTSVMVYKWIFIMTFLIGSSMVLVSKAASTSMTTDPYAFYWDSALGNQGASVIEFEGEIYWSSRANLAPTATYRYDNTGWWIQIGNENGESTYFYVNETSCLIEEVTKQDGVDAYGYYLYKISRETLIEGVESAGYSASDFFVDTITVELDGNVQIINQSGTVVAGSYSLMSESGLSSLLTKMSYYSFSTNSINVVTNELRNKILAIEGSDILLQYAISYNANGGSGGPENQVKYYGIPLEISMVIPERYGYEFLEWNTKSTGKGNGYQSGGIISTNQEQVLYAIWEAVTYTVSYDANTEDIVVNMPGSQVKTHDVALQLEKRIPEREGYSFVEWNIKSDGSGEGYLYESSFELESDTVLYAIWDAVPVLVVEDVYMYLSTELDEERFLENASALDLEDGDITESIVWVNRGTIEEDIETLMNTHITEDTEYQMDIEYEVSDSSGAIVVEKSVLHIYDIVEKTSAIDLANGGYVRFISNEYLNTLEEESVWREDEMFAYLESALY